MKKKNDVGATANDAVHSSPSTEKHAQDRTDRKPQENWEVKAAEYLDGWKRAQADLANFEKRQQETQGEIVKYANAAMIEELLPVVDNFERAFGALSESDRNNGWVKGFEYILQQLHGVVAKYGVEKFSSVGKEFDPEKHEAVEHVAGEADKVVEEVVAGYMMHGKVIRHAKVKVGNGNINK